MFNFIRRRRERQRAEMDRLVRDAVRATSDKLQSDLSELRQSNQQLSESLGNVTRERDTFKSKVREQTEGDLVVVSLKIIAKAVAGQPRDTTLEMQQGALQQQLGLQQQGYGLGAYGSIGAGFAGLFGVH